MEHVALTIPERAAIPKRIKISPALPVTAVGKLFKPALVDREIEETVRAEADRVGATVTSVQSSAIREEVFERSSRRMTGSID